MRYPLLALVFSLHITSVIEAREQPYGAVDHPALKPCDTAYFEGQRNRAEKCYQALLSGDAPLAIRAEAAWALGDAKTANRLFQQAIGARGDDWSTLTRWGELYADTHQNNEAMAIFREVLAGRPEDAFASMGAARVLAESFDPAASTYVTQLIANTDAAPGARLRALLLGAKMAMERSDSIQAATQLQQALALAQAENFNAFSAHALRAALAKYNNVDAGASIATAHRLNPATGKAHLEIAHYFEVTRRYSLAIDQLREAIDREPELAEAHEALGINLMRRNEFEPARRHLERAYALDPFSPVTVNTLRLLDSYDRFVIVTDPKDGENNDEVTIHLRLRADESDAIAPYAIAMTREAIKVFGKRYQFDPDQPIVIEMYPDHDDFAVRTAGMPGLGILGVAFGYVVAMDSPSGRPVNEFQWGTTLWHELAHVFTLSATNHLVPRWYSEGLSIYEEWRSGPNPGIRIPPSVYEAFAEDRLLPIAALNGGFVRPDYPSQVLVSYMQAGLVCVYIEEHFGEQKLADLLAAFGKGLKTEAALKAELGDAATELDENFIAWVEREHGKTYESLDAWQSSTAAATEALNAGDYHAAVVAARPAIELYPGYVEADGAWLALARAETALGKTEDALGTYQRWIEHGGYDPTALKRFAELARSQGETQRATDVLARINAVDPLDADHHVQLAEWLIADGRPAAAIDEIEVALALEPFDRARVLYLNALAHEQSGDLAGAQELVYQALTIAPDYREAQKLLVSLTRKTQ